MGSFTYLVVLSLLQEIQSFKGKLFHSYGIHIAQVLNEYVVLINDKFGDNWIEITTFIKFLKHCMKVFPLLWNTTSSNLTLIFTRPNLLPIYQSWYQPDRRINLSSREIGGEI